MQRREPSLAKSSTGADAGAARGGGVADALGLAMFVLMSFVMISLQFRLSVNTQRHTYLYTLRACIYIYVCVYAHREMHTFT